MIAALACARVMIVWGVTGLALIERDTMERVEAVFLSGIAEPCSTIICREWVLVSRVVQRDNACSL